MPTLGAKPSVNKAICLSNIPVVHETPTGWRGLLGGTGNFYKSGPGEKFDPVHLLRNSAPGNGTMYACMSNYRDES
jgi:hypothetical protein